MRFILCILSSIVLSHAVWAAAEAPRGADAGGAPTCWERCQAALSAIGTVLGVLEPGAGHAAPVEAPVRRVAGDGALAPHEAVEGEDPVVVESHSHLRRRGGGAGSPGRGRATSVSSDSAREGGSGARAVSRSPSRERAAAATAASDDTNRRLLGLGRGSERASEVARIIGRLDELRTNLAIARDNNDVAQCGTIVQEIERLREQVATLRFEADPA